MSSTAEQVAATEAALLDVARVLTGQLPPSCLSHRIDLKAPAPLTIGPTARRLLQQTLARGCVLQLVRRGGWETRLGLRDGVPMEGPVWRRDEPPALRFGSVSFELLQELAWLRDSGGGTTAQAHTGDELIRYLAASSLDLAGEHMPPSIAASALVRLAFPGRWEGDETTDFEVWMESPRATVLAALQADLARNWRASEARKRTLADPVALLRVGRAEGELLTRFLDAVDHAGRRDLASFLVDAAITLLAEHPNRGLARRSLSTEASLSDRQSAVRASASFWRAILRLSTWRQELATVAFFDEEYEVAQALLRQWRALDRAAIGRIEALVAELEAWPPPTS